MKKTFLPIIVLLVVLLVLASFTYWQGIILPRAPGTEQTPMTNTATSTPAVEVLAEGLSVPWDIVFLPAQAGVPRGDFLVTERGGRVVRIDASGLVHEVHIERVEARGEGGLLGIVLHPNFGSNRLLYLYMTTPAGGGGTENQVVQYRYADNALTQVRTIISGIPGAPYHDGGRMEFGPPASCESGQADCLLYITTGDATIEEFAQDKGSLAGKILRVRDDGSIPEGNPFGTAVWSWGHRNPQGLAWDSAGQLWETEHGRSGFLSGLDEINLIEAGKNYGWPEIEGSEEREGMVSPALHSGADDTWAPASLAYLPARRSLGEGGSGSLFFGGLRGEALYEAVLSGSKVIELIEHFKGTFGRVRTVRVGPDGLLYLTTSNRDGRGLPAAGDDKIIRINPAAL